MAETTNQPLAPTEHLKPPASADQVAAKDEKTVTMMFTRDTTLTMNNFRRVLFRKGVQEVPVSISENEHYAKWLADSGAKLYTPPNAPVAESDVQLVLVSDRHAAFLRSRGYAAPDAAAANVFMLNLQRDGTLLQFLRDFADWEAKGGQEAAPAAESELPVKKKGSKQ